MTLGSLTAQPGSLDLTFHAPLLTTQIVTAMAADATGRLMVATRTAAGDQTNATLFRLLNDGELDSSFTLTNTFKGTIESIVVQPDGTCIVAGPFSLVADVHVSSLARLKSDGSLDTTFSVPLRSNDQAHAVILLTNGSIVAAGRFADGTSNETTLRRFTRTGESDPSFRVATTTNSEAYYVVALKDGGVVASGIALDEFRTPRWWLIRFSSDGSMAASFQTPAISALLVLEDDRIAIAASYGQWQIFQFLSDGSPDPTFNSGATKFGLPPSCLAQQPDGKLLVGGRFRLVNSQPFPFVARVQTNGVLDETFRAPILQNGIDTIYPYRPRAPFVNSIVVQPNGQIIIGGGFTSAGDTAKTNIARLNGDTPPNPGEVRFSEATYYVDETTPAARLRVTRSGKTNAAVLIRYSTSNGSARWNQHYTPKTGLLRFGPGELSHEIIVPVHAGSLTGSVHFFVTLNNVSFALPVREPATAKVLIGNAQLAREVRFERSDYFGKENSDSVVIRVIRDPYSTGELAASFFVTNGTAVASQDYTSASGTLTFSPSQFTNEFSVALHDNSVADGSRNVRLRLYSQAETSLLSEATLTIFDDDAPIVVTTCDFTALQAALHGGGEVSLDCDGTLHLSSTLVVGTNVVVDAVGRTVILDGGNERRLFQVQPGAELRLHHLILANGRSTNGGAIYNQGTVTLIDCRLSNNVAAGASGQPGSGGTNGIFEYPASSGTSGTPGTDAAGGAVCNLGTLVAQNTVFETNQAIGGSGGRGGSGGSAGDIPESGVYDGLAGSGGNGASGANSRGGAIFNRGLLVLTNSSFTGNEARGGAGGAAGNPGDAGSPPRMPYPTGGVSSTGGTALGGAVFNEGQLLLHEGAFTDNRSLGGPGGRGGGEYWYSQNGGIAGTAGSVGASSGGGALYNAATAMIVRSTFLRNSAQGGSGGNGGHGTATGIWPGWGGDGGNGADGGLAFAGAIFDKGGALFSQLTCASNSANGGSGGRGGNGGISYYTEYSTGSRQGGAGGSGGNGGHAAGGGFYSESDVDFSSGPFAFIANTADGGRPGGEGFGGLYEYSGAGTHGSPGMPGRAQGGAVVFFGSVGLIADATLERNSALGGAGSLAGSGDGGSAEGGAIWSHASLRFLNSMFTSNTATGGHGARGRNGSYSSIIPVNRNGTAGRAGGEARGGALFTTNEVFSSNVVFVANKAVGGNGGTGGDGATRGFGGNGANGSASVGGAIYGVAPRFQFLLNRFLHNSAVAGNAGQAGYGPEHIGLGGNGGMAQGGALTLQGGLVQIHNSSFLGNFTLGGKGGNGLLTNGAPFAGDRAGGHAFAGALALSGGIQQISASTFASNFVRGGAAGDALSYWSMLAGLGGAGGAASGGAMYAVASTVGFTNCTFAFNAAEGGAGGKAPRSQVQSPGPGGFGVGGALHSLGNLALEHATLAGNNVVGGLGGEALFSQTATTNRGSEGASAGSSISASGSLFLHNSILSASDTNLAVTGSLMDAGYNICFGLDCSFTNSSSRNGIDPLLGPLSNNGGPTLTMPLLDRSPAINRGDISCAVAIDQRGVARPFRWTCDIGAYESAPPYAISGRVLDGTQPMAGVRISAGALNAVSDEEGFFHLYGFSNTTTLSFFRQGFDFQDRQIRATGNVIVQETNAYRLMLWAQRAPTGEALIGLSGVPGRDYMLQSATELDAWTDFSRVQVSPSGQNQFAVPVSEPSRRFFRLRR